MGAFYDSIPESLIPWLLAQKIFWVATAPLSGAGHVNVSPKGGPYFGLLGPRTFWYLELTGSGSETVAHLYEPGNGRITVQFNAFDGPPRILRLYGHGKVLERGDDGGKLLAGQGGEEFEAFVKENKVEVIPGTRSVVVVDVHQVGTSCGYSVPFFDFKDWRQTLNEYLRKMEEKHVEGDESKSMARYWALKNAWSVDGLPSLKTGQHKGTKEHIVPTTKMSGPGTMTRYRMTGAEAGGYGFLHLVLTAFISALLTALMLHYWARFAGGLDAIWVEDVRKAITSPLATLI